MLFLKGVYLLIFTVTTIRSQRAYYQLGCREGRDDSRVCYKAFLSPVNQSGAVSTCKQHGGHLTVISDKEAQAWMEQKLKKASIPKSSTFWIGARLQHLADWEWVNGKQLQDGDVSGFRSDIEGNEEFVGIWKPPRKRSDTYVSFHGSSRVNGKPLCNYLNCYYIGIAGNWTWYEARDYCTEVVDDLAIMNRTRYCGEGEPVSSQPVFYIIGLRKVKLIWPDLPPITGTADVSTFTNWDDDQPASTKDSQQVYVGLTYPSGKWKTFPNNTLLSTLCETYGFAIDFNKTTRPTATHDLIPSPSYKKECKETEKGLEYAGHISKTASGVECQAWNASSPHEHQMDRFPFDNDGGIDNAKNYCRNPDGTGWIPWCYTTSERMRWEYCDIPKCGKRYCRETEKGREYIGFINTTPSGLQCQAWNTQSPHSHNMDKFSFDNDGGIDNAKNYCRNPDGSWIPWCYTTDPKVRWEYCDIPKCDAYVDSPSTPAGPRSWIIVGVLAVCLVAVICGLVCLIIKYHQLRRSVAGCERVQYSTTQGRDLQLKDKMEYQGIQDNDQHGDAADRKEVRPDGDVNYYEIPTDQYQENSPYS